MREKKKAKESVRIELPHTKLTKDSNAVKSITRSKGYWPHKISTKINSVKLYRQTEDIGFVIRRYYISKASLMRWNKQYDGTRESLLPDSHRPHIQHPNAHTEKELNGLRNYHGRKPNISVCELYGKLLQETVYSRDPDSLYPSFVRLGNRKKVESTKKKFKHLGRYETPAELGVKCQLDVKLTAPYCTDSTKNPLCRKDEY